MASIFSLPNELILSSLYRNLPCREEQIRLLTTLLSIRSVRNIVIHGLEATGKSAVVKSVLENLFQDIGYKNADGQAQDLLRHAIIRSVECITGRHLLEKTIGAISKAVDLEGVSGRCENLSQLAVDLGTLLEKWTKSKDDNSRFVLVFDGIDHQRDAPSTLLPALARLGEIIPNLTTIFIVTTPRPHFLHLTGVPHIHFQSYTKPELLQILSHTKPHPTLPTGEKDTTEVWTRFTTAIYDSLSKHSGRDILSFRAVSLRLWPRFIAPILQGTHYATPFSRLLLANRSLLQNENLLVPAIIEDKIITTSQQSKITGIGTQLPFYPRLLLISAYLSSYNPPKTDILHFTKAALAKRRKKGGGTALSRTTTSKPGVSKHRKISRKLLGPQAFVLERMLAIFHALRIDAEGANVKRRKQRGNGPDRVPGSADVQMAIATLTSLRLLVKVGGGDVLDGGAGTGVKYRVAVGWDAVRGMARSIGLEVEDYLAE